MLENKWEVAPLANPDQVNEIQKVLNVPEVISNLLVSRGVDSFDKAKSYFRPQLATLHDPFLMEDMTIAVDRINKALKEEEKILIYGDYDVDGATSVALVYSYLKELGVQKGDTIYIFSDGYADQFGGIKGKKFKYKPFKSLLLSTVHKSMAAQKKEIDLVFEEWKGELEQIDDVCLFAIQV